MEIFATQFFRSLADTTRLRCLVLLEREKELCVCEFTHALSLAQPKVSRHLAHLRETRMVVDRRRGLWVFYRLDPGLPSWAAEVLRATARALESNEPFAADRKALKRMPDRPSAA